MCLHACNTNTLLRLTSHVLDKPFYQLHENILSYILLQKLTPHIDEICWGGGRWRGGGHESSFWHMILLKESWRRCHEVTYKNCNGPSDHYQFLYMQPMWLWSTWSAVLTAVHGTTSKKDWSIFTDCSYHADKKDCKQHSAWTKLICSNLLGTSMEVPLCCVGHLV